MCGIAGVLTSDRRLDVASVLSRMQGALRHRGPDDEGCDIVTTPAGIRVGLVHTRLAILDLTAAGRQPMADPDSGSRIVYNGEIYNHQQIRRQMELGPCRSTTDTETLLRAWTTQSDQILQSLRGMFAFAIYDARREHFWLVRDRLGIKPLYVCRASEVTWVFASELRAILASSLVSRKLNPAALRSYVQFGSVPAPWTLLSGVESVMPGESWQFDLTRRRLAPRQSRYWRPSFVDASKTPTRGDAVNQIRESLQDAARLRMLSDVPVGVFLSGGIDSSSIVSLLAHEGHQLQTFSVTFDENRYDESTHSNTISKHFGTEHTEIRLRSKSVLDQFESALAAFDQPSQDGINSYFISQAVRESGLKVAVSGLGGDELFAGYPQFRPLARLDRPIWRQLARMLHGVSQRLGWHNMKLKKLGALIDNQTSRLDRYLCIRRLMPPARCDEIVSARHMSCDVLPDQVRRDLSADMAELDPVNAHSLSELTFYMANVLLRDADQMSMAHGLEVRVPLTDHVLVETLAKLPGVMKVAPGRRRCIKALLVDALPEPLPRSVVKRRKMGFVLPWEQWLRRDLRDQVGELYNNASTCEQVGFKPDAVSRLWQDFLASRGAVRAAEILTLANLLQWAHRHQLSIEDQRIDSNAA